jgi:hypothetical protein
MTNTIRGARALMAGVAMLLVASAGQAASLKPDAKLPDPVTNALRAKYPKAVIERIDVLEENGVNVYDIEFSVGKSEHETDIAEDGTMLEFTNVIPLKEIPAAPLKTIREATPKGSKYGRIERIEIDYETKDGQVVKLPGTVIRYAAEMVKKGQQAEIVVNVDGSVSESPNWVPAAK